MKYSIIGFIPMCRSLLAKPELINVNIKYSVAMGIIEGFSLFMLIPAITALATGNQVWGMELNNWLIVLAVAAVLSGIVGYFQQYRGYGTALDLIKNLHRKIGDQVASLPLGWFSKPSSGKLSRMVSSELMMAGELIAHLLSPLLQRVTVTVVMVVLAFLWQWRLGLALLISTPLFLGFVMVSSWLARKGKALAEPEEIELSNRIVEFVHCQAALRACGRSENYHELTEANTNWLRAKRKELWYELFGNIIGGVFAQIVVVTLIVVAAQLALIGTLSPLATIAFIGMALRYSQVLTGIIETAVATETRRPLLDAILDVLHSEPLAEPEESAVQPIPGEIAFDHVDFGYQANKLILQDISFTVAPRQMVALVGSSGCGKTTIARLVSRFYEVNSGSVKVGGVDVRDLRFETLMSQLSMVFQDVYLFDDTLKANIQIGNLDATDAEVEQAARLAGVTEIVHRLPHGWQTPVGEGGKALSGGERQRVAIARALLKKAPIVLLDEATSALDPENEANVVAAVEKLRAQATVLVIAHKLDTIRKADKIVQLTHDGKVEDIGTHDELFARDGTYRKFWEKRAQATGWQLT